ncbi:PREDICTED: uncharacterized protein LOC105558769 [Vollenhovia emeryi]|uniref:uncharacterized protein LOC105558769 n=1 Tax=Vollenhovia emeryi TaxID=411798 RepID=UPI0005F4AC9D|nr:PREDICTED: uncharacterized protein LOC105558769 [Vollenhovia emeryi]
MYLLLICMYSYTVNSINIFEFYIFARCLQIKLGLINKFLSDILTDLSKEMKAGLFQDKNVCKIINVKNYEKHVIPTNMIFQWRQATQPQINNSMSEKCDPIVFHIEPHFPSQVKEEFQNVLQNHSQRRNNSKMTKSQKCTFLLQVIKQVHLELCKVSKIICTILGVQVAWEIGVIIIFLIETFYKFYVECFMNEHKVADFVGETFVKLALCTLYTTQIVLLSCVCKSAAEEGNRTIEIIHTIYGCNADVDLREEIQQFGIQILQHPMTFSVFGLTLDNQVLSMILKTVTTYMVIMVEVSNTLESNNAIEYSHF